MADLISRINAHFEREGMQIVVDNARPCSDTENVILFLIDPLMREAPIERILWVNVVGQDEKIAERLWKNNPEMPREFNNYVAEWDEGKRWAIRFVC